MTLTDIAIQNLRRRKGKTVFMVLTFLLVVGTMVSLVTLSANMKENLQQGLAKYGANIIITPRSKHFSLSYGGIVVPGVNFAIQKLDYSVLTKIKNSGANVSSVSPKIIGLAKGAGKNYLIVGLDFPIELQMKPWLKVKGNLPGKNQVVIGSALAAADKLTVGSSIRLLGQNYPVSGILSETGDSEDNAVFTDFSTAGKLTGIRSAWSLIEVNSLTPDATASRLAKVLPEAKVGEVSQLVQGTKESLDSFTAYALFTSVLLAVIGLLIVGITMLGSIRERTAELGIFRAIGFRRRHIFSLIVREVTLVSLLGGLLGYVLGVAASPLAGPLLLHRIFSFQPHLVLGVAVLLGSVIGGTVAIAYPAWRVVSMDPADALRYI